MHSRAERSAGLLSLPLASPWGSLSSGQASTPMVAARRGSRDDVPRHSRPHPLRRGPTSRTPLGTAVLGTGVAGEFWPIIVISIFLTGVYGALEEFLLLLVFGAIIIGAARIALSARPPRVLRVLQDTVHTTGQTAVRAAVFLLGLLVFLAADAGFEFVLGAFAAGLIVGLALDSPEGAPWYGCDSKESGSDSSSRSTSW